MGREEQVAPIQKVRSERRDGVLIVVIENPPTAALSADVRNGLMRELDEAVSDSSVRAIVLTGSDGSFATGASLNETPGADVPDLATVCDRIEASEKPVVAAIQGAALGGGLELALAAHLRVATPSARLGAPDITLGLVPNAGGTQRLPKVVGGVAALKLLLSGRAVNGEVAQKLGLVDVVEAQEPVAVAIRHALRLAQGQTPLMRSSARRDRLGEGTAFLEAVATHRRAADVSPLDAPLRVIDCVESALLLPYDIGRGIEQAAFEDLLASEHSKSLRHIFSAERKLQAATRWEGRVPSRPVNGIAIVGARAIGAELVVQCLDAGFSVAVAEASDEALEEGTGRIIGHYDARVSAGQMSEDEVESVLERMQAVSGFESLGDVDIVIDALPTLSQKRVMALDSAMKAGAVMIVAAENVDIDSVAKMTNRSADVVGLRLYPGLKKNRLAEMAAGEATGPRALATARALARKFDRLILDVGPSREGIGTRIAEALHAAADLCLEDGARVGQIDAALKDWGLPFGSFAWRDVTGIRRVGAPQGLEGQRGGGIDAVLVSTGRIGMPVGRGYYTYRERGKPGAEDPEVQNMIDADRTAKGVSQRPISDGEIRARCVAAMAGAGAAILADGTARRPSDIDMVAVHGLGFARRTGGVMFAADLMGLAEVARQLQEMSRVSARIAPPNAVLNDILKSETTFADLND